MSAPDTPSETLTARRRAPILWCLRLAASALFAARGYLYLSDFAPLSVFFWHQAWLEAPLQILAGLDWESYSAHSDGFIRTVQRGMGAVFLVASVACWRVCGAERPYANGIVLAGALCLLPYWLLRWVDANYQAPMLLEHFLQWGTPLLLVLWGRIGENSWRFLAWLLIAATFTGHGFYALGWGVPQNNDYLNMTMRLLHVETSGAKAFLHAVGLLDLLVPVALWFPRLRKLAAVYAALWGLATAAARIVSHWTPAEDYYGMHPWIAEAVVRLPHGLVPLALLFFFILQDSRLRRSSNPPSL